MGRGRGGRCELLGRGRGGKGELLEVVRGGLVGVDVADDVANVIADAGAGLGRGGQGRDRGGSGRGRGRGGRGMGIIFPDATVDADAIIAADSVDVTAGVVDGGRGGKGCGGQGRGGRGRGGRGRGRLRRGGRGVGGGVAAPLTAAPQQVIPLPICAALAPTAQVAVVVSEEEMRRRAIAYAHIIPRPIC